MTKDSLLDIRENGYCILRQHFSQPLIDACREAFWPILLAHIEAHRDTANRGPYRHFLPMPFTAPCFVPEFFFDETVLRIMRGAMGDRVVADQWGCDTPVRGSSHQGPHVDYQHPLFAEIPDLELPIYMLVVSFGLVPVTCTMAPLKLRRVLTDYLGEKLFERSNPLKSQCSRSRCRSVMS
jgi:hypothetical protein